MRNQSDKSLLWCHKLAENVTIETKLTHIFYALTAPNLVLSKEHIAYHLNVALAQAQHKSQHNCIRIAALHLKWNVLKEQHFVNKLNNSSKIRIMTF